MTDPKNEVLFCEYCKTCKHKLCNCEDEPCCDCLATPVNYYSHKPVLWEGVDTLFNKPVERRDHAAERAVREAILLNAKDLAEVEEPKNNLASKVHMRDVISASIAYLQTSCDCTGMTYGDLMMMLQRTITGQLVLDPSVKVIDTSVTKGYTGYTMVMAPGVETIGNGAFINNRGLTSIILPGLESIGGSAFENCVSLNFEQCSAENIGAWAFKGCNSLHSAEGSYGSRIPIRFPNLITAGAGAFENCSKLDRIDLPSLTAIPTDMFSNCDRLYTISDAGKVKSIGDGAFRYCSNFTGFTGTEVPTLESIGESAFYGSGISELKQNLITIIDKYTCYACSNLAEVECDNVLTVGLAAFASCRALKTVKLPKATTVGVYGQTSPFNNCTNLKRVELPSVVKFETWDLFKDCGNLEYVDIQSTESISRCMFEGCTNLRELIAPNLKSVDAGAFDGCSSLTFDDIDLSKITNVGMRAFQGCSSLTRIYMPLLTALLDNGSWFSDCTSLETVDLPNLKIMYTGFAFDGCTKLRTVSIPKITGLKNTLFRGCTVLETIDISEVTSVPTIHETTFYQVNDTFKILVPPTLFRTWYNQTGIWANYKDHLVPKGVDVFHITTSANDGGTVESSLGTIAMAGETGTISARPNDGKTVSSVTLDGTDVTDQLQRNYAVTLLPVPETVSGASYGFTLNSNGYYESTNKKVSNSAAVCKINFNFEKETVVKFDIINSGESNYDYGILGKVDKVLATSNTSDSLSLYAWIGKGKSSASIVKVNYTIPAGEHFIYMKYRKNGSGNNGNDSLQFKIMNPEVFPPDTSIEKYYYTCTLENIQADHDIVVTFGDTETETT